MYHFHCSSRAPEILFKPQLIGRDHYGMHESIFKSILSSDIDLRRCFLENIVLSGNIWFVLVLHSCTEIWKSWKCFNLLCPALVIWLKVGTHYCLACLSGSRLKSKDWGLQTWGWRFVSQAPKTETSWCGVEEQCWSTYPPSALHGSVGMNMRSVDHRLSSASVSEMDDYVLHVISSNAKYTEQAKAL